MAASDSATTFLAEEGRSIVRYGFRPPHATARRSGRCRPDRVGARSTSGFAPAGTRSAPGGVNRSLLPKVGEPAPDFMTEDVFGNPVRLSQFKGQPVWLMFWGSWCPPCRAEFPDIQAAYAQLEPEGIRMLGVSLREPAIDAGAYAAQNGATFLVLSDPDESDTASAYPDFQLPDPHLHRP